MKKTTPVLLTVLCALALLSGCARPSDAATPAPAASAAPVSAAPAPTDPAPTDPPRKLDAVPFADGQLYAVAWVGYNDTSDLPYYLDLYVDGSEAPTHYVSGGDVYLILPRYPDMELRLYQNDLETGATTLIYSESNCGPFLLQCNVSDIFPDVTISLSGPDGSAEFSPYISSMDGSVQIGEQGLNLTK